MDKVELLLRSVKLTLHGLLHEPDPNGKEVLHFLGELSIAVEDGWLNLSEQPNDGEEIRQLMNQAKEKILDWEWLYDGFKSCRKNFPKSHWWWYPEEI